MLHIVTFDGLLVYIFKIVGFAMKYFLIIVLLVSPIFSFAQNREQDNDGNWSTATNWVNGDIGNALSHNVQIANGVTTTILNTESFTIGSLTIDHHPSSYARHKYRNELIPYWYT